MKRNPRNVIATFTCVTTGFYFLAFVIDKIVDDLLDNLASSEDIFYKTSSSKQSVPKNSNKSSLADMALASKSGISNSLHKNANIGNCLYFSN